MPENGGLDPDDQLRWKDNPKDQPKLRTGGSERRDIEGLYVGLENLYSIGPYL